VVVENEIIIPATTFLIMTNRLLANIKSYQLMLSKVPISKRDMNLSYKNSKRKPVIFNPINHSFNQSINHSFIRTQIPTLFLVSFK